MEKRNIREATLRESLFSLAFLVVCLAVGIIGYKTDPHVPMFVGSFGAIFIAYRLGYRWEEIESFLQIQKSKHQNDGIYPMSFAGSDPVLLLDIIGAFGEAFEGYDSYNKAVEILTQSAAAGTSFDAKETANKLFINPYAPLAYSFSYLKQFIKQGYVTPAYTELKNTDINSYLQQRVTNLIITNLSTHRTFDVKAISRYSSIFVPSKKRPEQRHFTANITYAVPVSSNKNDLTSVIRLFS